MAVSPSIYDNYNLQDQIGRGKFSVVYKAISKKDNQSYAVKVIDKNRLTPEERDFLL